jgi:hypothetical protein
MSKLHEKTTQGNYTETPLKLHEEMTRGKYTRTLQKKMTKTARTTQ